MAQSPLDLGHRQLHSRRRGPLASTYSVPWHSTAADDAVVPAVDAAVQRIAVEPSRDRGG